MPTLPTITTKLMCVPVTLAGLAPAVILISMSVQSIQASVQDLTKNVRTLMDPTSVTVWLDSTGSCKPYTSIQILDAKVRLC